MLSFRAINSRDDRNPRADRHPLRDVVIAGAGTASHIHNKLTDLVLVEKNAADDINYVSMYDVRRGMLDGRWVRTPEAAR